MFYYINYFNELVKSGSFFWFCALSGTGMLIIQFVINIFGGTGQDNIDVGETSDAGNDSADVRKFKWLSMQALTGFLTMFGWTAITCQSEFDLQIVPTIGISVASGVLAALIIRSIFKYAKKLQSTGSSYNLEDAIGKEAYVYQTIPKNGVGKISISLQQFTHEIDAVSHNSEELSSFTHVKIIEKKDDNTVVVALL
jgi:membrane protein implicated in regulation of membrane protease activity